MTGNKCLLDTSVIIHAFRDDNAVSATLDALFEGYVPLTVIGELFYGAYKSVDPAKHITIPENDTWIAAMAQQYNLPLFTTDKHFAAIESIALLDYSL